MEPPVTSFLNRGSHYKVVYKYEVGVLPTRGMVDLECKVGQSKVVMRKVVISALDIHVLSSFSLDEWVGKRVY